MVEFRAPSRIDILRWTYHITSIQTCSLYGSHDQLDHSIIGIHLTYAALEGTVNIVQGINFWNKTFGSSVHCLTTTLSRVKGVSIRDVIGIIFCWFHIQVRYIPLRTVKKQSCLCISPDKLNLSVLLQYINI